MPQQRNALKAGSFMLLSLAAIVAIVVAIRGFGSVLEPVQHRTAHFRLTDDLGGLQAGDDVRIGGYRVGSVRSISIEQSQSAAEPPRIVVAFSLPRRYTIRQGAALSVQAGLIGGTSVLNFQGLGGGQPLAPDEPIAGQIGGFAALTGTLGDIAPQVVATLREIRTGTVPRLNTALDRTTQTFTAFQQTGEAARDLAVDLKGRVDPIVQRYNAVTDSGRQMLDRGGEMMVQVRDLVGDTKTDFRGTVANLNSATGTIKDRMPKLMAQAETILAKVDTALTGINRSVEGLQAAIGNTRDLTSAARGLVVSNKGRIDGMVASLKATGDNLKAASAEVRRSPWRLLYKPGPNEVANLNLFDAARQFAEGATDLSDAAIALRDGLANPAADRAQLQKLLEKVESTFTQFQTVEQKLWNGVRE